MYKILTLSFVFLLLDQLSKWFVVFYLDLQQKLFLNLNNQFINFYMAWNKGIILAYSKETAFSTLMV